MNRLLSLRKRVKDFFARSAYIGQPQSFVEQLEQAFEPRMDGTYIGGKFYTNREAKRVHKELISK